MSEEYVETDLKDECEKCHSRNTVTYVKRVYIPTEIDSDDFKEVADMPYLKYKQICNNCRHKDIYFLQ